MMLTGITTKHEICDHSFDIKSPGSIVEAAGDVKWMTILI